MKMALSAFVIFLGLIFAAGESRAGDYKKGEVYNGFKLIEKRFVKEVNAECYYFEHVKSGARLFKIASDDANKTFSIAFKTDPESDCGTPHIMEHSVLNGSKNYPVKSPFDILQKGSLSTFMNAFTGSDLTCFPFASMNSKDYFNLMHVYLDAVFNPLFKTDSRVFKQEGWHYELEKTDAPIVYKGVVYNEMKGAYSNPTRELGYRIYKNLFPDNGYNYSSGGYPSEIPNLTYQKFVEFHNKYYHPSNSYILLYGNADLNEELAFIDREYLSKYNKAEQPKSFPLQKPFNALKDITCYYPVTEGSKTENQTYLTLNFVAGLNTDRATTMALNILSDVLVNQEAAPIRLALQKAGIGQDVNASVDELQQNVFQIMVQNANPGDKDKFHEIVINTLRDIVKNGLDKKVIEGAINRTEFQLREGNDAQKGITYNFQVLPGWFFANDPYLTLEYEKPLSKVKTALESNYLESIIQQYILDNKHALLLMLEPKPGLEKENSAAIEKKLQDYSSSLSGSEKATLVKETQDLITYQKTEDTPQALNTMPLLSTKDINPKAEWYGVTEKKVNGVPLLVHNEFCNNVVYTRMMFKMSGVPVELLPYASLLTSVLGSQNTDNYSYGDLDNELNINTGGYNVFTTNYLVNKEDSKLDPRFVFESKAMNGKVDKMMNLASEIINKTHYKDADRMKDIIVRLQSRLESQVKSSGMQYARLRLSSYFTNSGKVDELTGGIEYYWFISDLAKNYDARSKEITENLEKVASIIFNRSNLLATVTSDKADLPAFTKELEKFTASLPDKNIEPQVWNFNLEKKNEGFLTTSKVQYVIKGYNLKKLGYKWDGKINVLSQILSTDWLQTRLRVMGGAYGGFSNFFENGDVFFISYRDPNLKETLVNYDAMPEYLDKLEVDEKGMTRYIIGTIANLDNPLTPSQKGNRAVTYYLEKTTADDLQKERDAILSTSLQDIKSMKKMIKDIVDQNNICVYGNEQKIQSQKELFNKVEKLIK